MDALQAEGRSRFNASAHFAFITSIGNDLDPDGLLNALLLADKAAPWVTHYVSGERAPSIHWHSEPRMREGEWIDRRYELEIRPFGLLSRGQLLAYERYAEAFAQSLAKLRLQGVLSIEMRVTFSGLVTNYRCD